MALGSYGEAEIIVECEKKTATGRSAVTSEWTLASRKGSQPGCVMGRTTLGCAVALWSNPSSNLSWGVQSAIKPNAYESMQGVRGVATGREEPLIKKDDSKLLFLLLVERILLAGDGLYMLLDFPSLFPFHP